jgi:hypothetical protein
VPVLPTCLALLLCEQVVHHADTGKTDLLGVFWDTQTPAFPGRVEPFSIWVALVNGAGKVPMRVSIEYLPDRPEEELVVDLRFTMEFRDRRVVGIYWGRVDGLALDNPGHYRVTLIAYDIALVQGYFIASPATPPS